jgi:hypothetical protein
MGHNARGLLVLLVTLPTRAFPIVQWIEGPESGGIRT